MRKKIFSIIQDEIDKEIHDLDLKAILKQAQISEDIPVKPKRKPWLIPVFRLASVFILLFALIILPTTYDNTNTPESSNSLQGAPSLLLPSLTLYQFLEDREIVSESEGVDSFLLKEIKYLDLYLKTVAINYFNSPEFQETNPKNEYQKTYQTNDLSISLRTTNKERIEYEIEITDSIATYPITGYLEANRLTLKMSTGENSYIEIRKETDMEIKTYQDGVLTGNTKIITSATDIEITDIIRKTTYLIKENNQGGYSITYGLFSSGQNIGTNLNLIRVMFISATKQNDSIIYEVNLDNEIYIFNIQE
ncbi:MAG TPA: hypothetical protein GX692_08900 [Acholeplasmataceae bacterium]|nr:hypothetical protein [Acholeplasmataceae bacterium]